MISAEHGGVAAEQIGTVKQHNVYRRFVSADPRVIGPALLAGAVIAVVLVTVTALPTPAGVGLGLMVGVIVWVALSLRHAAAAERTRREQARTARAAVLESLAAVTLTVQDQNLRTLLSPEQALISLHWREILRR